MKIGINPAEWYPVLVLDEEYEHAEQHDVSSELVARYKHALKEWEEVQRQLQSIVKCPPLGWIDQSRSDEITGSGGTSPCGIFSTVHEHKWLDVSTLQDKPRSRFMCEIEGCGATRSVEDHYEMIVETGADPLRAFDHAALLRKYIAWVDACEGVNYIDSGSYYHEEEHFTPEEWAELQRIAQTLPEAS